MSNACPNCGAAAGAAYCPTCGQSQNVAPKTLRDWSREFLDETLAIDGRLWRSLSALLVRPGFLAREWEDGRRARWTHPLRLYLLASFILVGVTLIMPTSVNVSASGSLAPELTDVASDMQSDEMLGALQSNYTYMMLVLVPLFALYLKLLYRRAGVLYVGHLVHALNIHAMFFLVLAATLPLEGLAEPWSSLIQAPFLIWMLLYSVPSCRRAYRASWIGAALRTAVLLPVHFVSVMAGIFVVALATGTLSPQSGLQDAHDAYWEVRNALGNGDTVAARDQLPGVIAGYARTEYLWFGPHVTSHFADALLLSGEAETARKEAERALMLDPEFVIALGIAARAATEMGDSAAAADFWHRYLAAYPPPDSVNAVGGNHTVDLIRDLKVAQAWMADSAQAAATDSIR